MNIERGRLPLGLLAAAPVLLCLSSCESAAPSGAAGPQAVEAGAPLFEDVTATTNIVHTCRNGEEADHLTILESLGGGVALLDVDGDGLLDVFLTGGGTFGGPDNKQIRGLPCKLYRNRGRFTFEDVTSEAGLDRIDFYTHGAAAADYDRDGFPDLLVTGWGRLALFRNDRGHRFTDVTRAARLTSTSWSTSAGWGDFDGDGYPDLYVCRYVDWSFANHPPCNYPDGTRELCPPRRFGALPDVLYRNNGDGTFTDVSRTAGLRLPRDVSDYEALLRGYEEDARRRLRERVPDAELAAAALQAAEHACDRLRQADAQRDYGKGLGTLLVDVNGDGRPDIYVANDTTDNFLYINRSSRGHILFEEVGPGSGVTRDNTGRPNGSMGVDAGDPFGTGRPAIWVSNYEGENHALYVNECKEERLIFRYGTPMAGITAIGQAYVGWGTAFVDVDHDGWEDLLVSNGHAYRFPQGKAGQAQRAVLMMNRQEGDRRGFVEVGQSQGGRYFQTEHRGRGLATGDLDNDGCIDVVVSHVNEPVAVLRGLGSAGRHWLGVELARAGQADVVGARVQVRAGGRTQTRFAKGGGSYLSSPDRRHLFGLGAESDAVQVTVAWPSGTPRVQQHDGLVPGRYYRIVQGDPNAHPASGAQAAKP
jgi:hypothetical protein